MRKLRNSARSLLPPTLALPTDPPAPGGRLMPSSSGHGDYNHSPAPAASTQNLMSSNLSSANSSKQDISSSSLSVNYLPQKFGTSGLRNRAGVPRGGGREAFGPGAARMAGDDDYDAVGWPGGGKDKRKRRWNKFKWTLFLANLLVRLARLCWPPFLGPDPFSCRSPSIPSSASSSVS